MVPASEVPVQYSLSDLKFRLYSIKDAKAGTQPGPETEAQAQAMEGAIYWDGLHTLLSLISHTIQTSHINP